MKRTKPASWWLLTFTLVAAGCAKSPFNLSNRERTSLTAVQESRLLNATEAPMPSILPETHYAAGRLFESQGQLDRALEQYQKSVVVNRRFARGYHRIGLLLSKMSRHGEAVEAFQRTVELEPNDANFRNNFGFELMFVQRWSEAEAQLRRAIELDPTLARAHVNLAMALSKQERFDEALGAFQRVLPEPDAHYNLGLLYRGQGKYGQASRTFQHVLTLSPGFTAARRQLAELTELVGREGLGDRAQRFTQDPSLPTGAESTTFASAQPPPAIPKTPSAALKKPTRTFWIPGRQPDPALATKIASDTPPTTHGFTATSRFSSASDDDDSRQVSYLDEFPAPTTIGDLASNVAMIDDEINCIRAELERLYPGYLANDDAVVTAITGVPSPYQARPSHRSSDDPLFPTARFVERGSTFEDAEPDCDEESVVTMTARPSLLDAGSRTVASRISESAKSSEFQTKPVNRAYVDEPSGIAFARGTWADTTPSKNPDFHRQQDIAALNDAIARVRERQSVLERADEQARRAYAVARADAYQGKLVSSETAARQNVPTTLRDFARVQLNGEGPDALAAMLSKDVTPHRSLPDRSKKSTLVKDKPIPTTEPKRGRPRTDARELNEMPMLTPPRPGDPWFMPPANVMGLLRNEGAPRREVIVRDAWLEKFDELDGLIAIIRNEMVCDGTIKLELAAPYDMMGEPGNASELEPEPIMSLLLPTELLNVCDPSLPDTEVDTVTMSDARSHEARNREDHATSR